MRKPTPLWPYYVAVTGAFGCAAKITHSEIWFFPLFFGLAVLFIPAAYYLLAYFAD